MSDYEKELEGGDTENLPTSNPETPEPAVLSKYELMRRDNLEQNRKHLEHIGIDLSMNLLGTLQNENEPQKKLKSTPSVSSKKRRKPGTNAASDVRRSDRKRRNVEYFSHQDFSRGGILERRVKALEKERNLSLTLSVMDRTLIDKLAAEAYVRTSKLATTEAKKLRLLDNNDDEDLAGKKKKKKTLKKIHKAVEIYSRTWMPKGARCELVWNIDFFRSCGSDDETVDPEDADKPVKIKEERVEFAEETFQERFLPSLVQTQKKSRSKNNEPVVVGTIDLTSEKECPIDEWGDIFEEKPVSGKFSGSTETSVLEAESTEEPGEKSGPRFSRQSSILHQTDFYACLVQESQQGRQEHVYPMEDQLEPFPEKADGEQRKFSERIQNLKENAKVEVIESGPVESIDPTDPTEEKDTVDEKRYRFRLKGLLYWTVPMDLSPGQYYVEIGSQKMGQCARTEMFNVTEAFGVVDNTTVGSWCICGENKKGDKREAFWIRCELCLSWHHWQCYEKKNKKEYFRGRIDPQDSSKRLLTVKGQARKMKRMYNAAERSAKGNSARNKTISEVVNVLVTFLEMHPVERDENEERTKFPEKDLIDLTKYAPADGHETAEARLIALKKQAELASVESNIYEAGFEELENMGHERNGKASEDTRFRCWMCFEYDLDKIKSPTMLHNLELSRLHRLISMIKQASGGYARRSVETASGKKHKNVYSTPNSVVCYLGTLLEKYMNADAAFIDLGAGEGRLGSILPPQSTAVEFNRDRFLIGREKVPNLRWINEDALSMQFCSKHAHKYDFVVSNPDFEVALPFIVVSFFLLSKTNPDARLYFILPSDFFEASFLRSRIYKILPFTIEREYKLGHLSYLDSDPRGQKLSVDSLFVLKLGRESKFEHITVNARLAGML